MKSIEVAIFCIFNIHFAHYNHFLRDLVASTLTFFMMLRKDSYNQRLRKKARSDCTDLAITRQTKRKGLCVQKFDLISVEWMWGISYFFLFSKFLQNSTLGFNLVLAK